MFIWNQYYSYSKNAKYEMQNHPLQNATINSKNDIKSYAHTWEDEFGKMQYYMKWWYIWQYV